MWASEYHPSVTIHRPCALYDLQPPRASHRIASHRIARTPPCAALAIHGLAGRVCVHNMNMIDGVLSNTGLLFLTSQCWEDELLVLVRAKIEAELPVGEYP